MVRFAPCFFNMKWLIVILLLSYGCKKCAECTTTVTQKVTGQPATVGTTKSEMCGDELEEADGYAQSTVATVDGMTAVITTKIECK